MSNYLEGGLGDLLFQGSAFTAPDTYAALYTATPGETDAGTEATGGSYARELIENDLATSPYWNAESDGLYDNNGDCTFTTASAAWGTIDSMGLRDASTAGNLLLYGDLSSSKVVDINDTFKFASGDLDVTLA